MGREAHARFLEAVNREGSLERVARVLDVSIAMVSYIASGKRKPGLKLAAKIETHYGIPASLWTK
jgi:transcriptional regulator with XRE-family HTH domain